MRKAVECQDRKCLDGIVGHVETPSGGKFSLLCPTCWPIEIERLKNERIRTANSRIDDPCLEKGV